MSERKVFGLKKLLLCICLSILLVMAAGCQAEKVDSPQIRNTGIRPLPPEDPGSSLMEYDPDRQVYIGSENVYMDHYMGITGAPYLDIPVYAKSPLGEQDEYGYLTNATVELLWDQFMVLFYGEQYSCQVTRIAVPHKTEFMAGEDDAPESVMPYYVYQAYRGGDAYALADARVNYVPREGVTDPLRADFEALTAEDLPEFYVYNIRIQFLDMPEPDEGSPWVLEKLKLTVDGKTYEGTFGGVRLFNRADCPDPKTVRTLPEYADTYTGSFSELYSDGIVKVLRIPVINRLDIEKDCTKEYAPDLEYNYAWIDGVWTLDEGSKVLAAYATVRDQDGQCYTFTVGDLENFDSVWPGESLYVDVVLENKHADKLLSNNHFQIVVSWCHYALYPSPDGPVSGGCAHLDTYTVVSTTNTNHYENYAIIFDGVDMEPYYDYYFENYESWRKKYSY